MTDQPTPDPIEPDPVLEPEPVRPGRLARARARLGATPGWAKGAGAVLLGLVLIFGIGVAGFAIGQEGGHGEGGSHGERHGGEHGGHSDSDQGGGSGETDEG